jgi:hypothetical protein
MVAEGAEVIVTPVVVLNAAQPPAAGTLYVTVYEPGVLVDGVMSPLAALIERPAAEEKVPPAVPTSVTLCGADTVLQNGVPLYVIVALGVGVMVTDVVVL